MASCQAAKDCRVGYICADPKADPWRALILDDVQTNNVCIPSSSQASVSTTSATPPVCSAAGPTVPAIDAAAPWTPADGGSDADLDAGADVDAADAG